MFETRSQAWQEVGLLHQVSPRAARRARVEGLVLAVLFVAVVVVYDHRQSLFSVETPGSTPEVNTLVQILTVLALLGLGWAIARDAGRALGPALFRRMDPATAGTVGFLVRLATAVLALLVALGVARVEARALALGGAFTAVVLGLAAQQTLGNLIAGTVLLSAGPFRVGDHVRLQGGPLAGQIEGVVSSLGLLYTTFATAEGSVLVPNSVVLAVAVHTGKGRLGGGRGASVGARESAGEAGSGEEEQATEEPRAGAAAGYRAGGRAGGRAPKPPTR